jgi:uncharacterized protein YuzE
MKEDQLYVRVGKGRAARTEEFGETASVMVDFDKEGEVIGVEVICDYRLIVGGQEIQPKRPPSNHLLVRKDTVLCTVCHSIAPIHPGDGTPLPTYLMALDAFLHDHPAKPH